MAGRTLSFWLDPLHRPCPRPRSTRKPRVGIEEFEERQLLNGTIGIPALLDFGRGNSPVAPGAVKITPVAYTTTLGYGWEYVSSIRAIDRGTGDPLIRDFHRGTSGTFLLDLPNGSYQVSAVLGDPQNPLDRVDILAEGRVVAGNLTAAAGQTARPSFQVDVTDGQMRLQLIDRGGANPYFSLAALNIEPAGPVSPPSADAGPDRAALEGQAVSFAGSAGGQSSLSYAWDFGDGATTIGTLTPSHTYADNGTYTVTLRATDAAGQTAQDTAVVTVGNVAPSASASGPYAGASGLTIAFSSTVTDPSPADRAAGFTYLWDFGDGATSTQQAPGHAYTRAGSYTVRLTVRDKDGGTTTVQTTALVNVPAPLTVNAGPDRTANEGSGVSFSATITGGAGPLSYAWNFGDGSPAASAPTPSYAFLDNGVYTVMLTVTDALGATAQDTLVVAVANVAPTGVSVGGPYTLQPGTPLTFAPTGTDPSVIDLVSPFTVVWNFGDGGTLTQVTPATTYTSPSHTYAAPGAYTVSLTATDKDGGSTSASGTVTVTAPTPPPAPPGSEITTPWGDRIPHFGANPTITSITSGSWSSAGTWSLGRLPVAGDVVAIRSGNTVTYDLVSDAALKTVSIESGGRLLFRTDINTRLTVSNLLVLEGGELQIGTSSGPVPLGIRAEVIIPDLPLDRTADPESWGNGLIGLGKVTMHGAVKSDTWQRLAVEPRAGQTTLTLAQPVSGWRPGDRVVLPDTRELAWAERGTAFVGQWELLTIASVSADGRVITLSSPLRYDHLGARNGNGAQELLPHVGNTSRNVVVKSQNATGNRGHAVFTNRAEVDVRYAAFSGLGRTTNSPDDNTTFGTGRVVTRLGTNQEGRYPVNFRHLMGPAAASPSGYQFTFAGNSVLCPLTPMPFRWGVTIHDSHYGLIKDNVIYNWAGAGLMTVDGSESYNVIERNLVVRVDGTGTDMDRGRNGAGFWISGPNNYVRHNVASTVYSPGGYQHHGFDLNFRMLGNVRVPAYRGASTAVAGQYTTLNVNRTPVLQFEGNEAYGAISIGVSWWWVNFDGNTAAAIGAGAGTLRNFTTWSFYSAGAYGYESNGLTVDGLTIRGKGTPSTSGVMFSDYFTGSFTLRNANIQGTHFGFTPSTYTTGTQTIQNSYLRNLVNVYVSTLWHVSYRSDFLGARRTVVDNVRFDAWGSDPLVAIKTWANVPPAGSMYTLNLVQRDEIFVYNYQQVPGQNFQVYYQEQAAGFVLPQTTYNTDGSPRMCGAPAAGLTNARAWAQYGVALAGAVAAPGAVTRSEFVWGLVRSL